MAFYRVLVHGYGLMIPIDDVDGPEDEGDDKNYISGFYTTEYVFAQNEGKASAKALKNVYRRWPIKEEKNSLKENIDAKNVVNISAFNYFVNVIRIRGSGKGYTLY